MIMTMATRTVTINAAFLQEIKEDNAELRALLAETREMCEMCEAHPSARIRPRQFASLLAELRDQLAMYFSLEEAYGYFDKPVFVAPHQSERADSLRKQHAKLYEEIARLAVNAEDISSGSAHLRGIRKLFRRFLNFHFRLEDHETKECELIAEVHHAVVSGSNHICSN